MSDAAPGGAQSAPQNGRPTAALLDARLRAAFVQQAPDALNVTDDSHLHAGHAGAREGSHFSVHLVSGRFKGLTRVARHRLVYDLLGAWMQRGIHALALTTVTPDEAQAARSAQGDATAAPEPLRPSQVDPSSN